MATDPDTGVTYKRRRTGPLYTGYFNKIGLPGVQSFQNGLQTDTPWSREQIAFDGDASQLFYPPDMFQIENRIVYIKVQNADGTYAQRRVGYLDSDPLALVTFFPAREDFINADLSDYPKGAMAAIPGTLYVRDPDAQNAISDKPGWREYVTDDAVGFDRLTTDLDSRVRGMNGVDVRDYIDPTEMSNISAFTPTADVRGAFNQAYDDVPDGGVIYFPPGRYMLDGNVLMAGGNKSITLLGNGAVFDFSSQQGNSDTTEWFALKGPGTGGSTEYMVTAVTQVRGNEGPWTDPNDVPSITLTVGGSGFESSAFSRNDRILIRSSKFMQGNKPTFKTQDPGAVLTVREVDAANNKIYTDQWYLNDTYNWADASQYDITVRKIGLSQFHVRGIEFIGPYIAPDAGLTFHWGLLIEYGSRCVVSDCTFRNFYFKGLDLRRSDDVMVRNCRFMGFDFAYKPDDQDMAYRTRYTAASVTGTRKCSILGCHAERVRRLIDVEDSNGFSNCASLLVANNTVINSVSGFGNHFSGEDGTYLNNLVINCIGASGFRSMNQTFRGNTFMNCASGISSGLGYGLGGGGAQKFGNFVAQSNSFLGSSKGILLLNDFNNIVIQNNFMEVGYVGIEFRCKYMGNVNITDNVIHCAPQTGVEGTWAAEYPEDVNRKKSWDDADYWTSSEGQYTRIGIVKNNRKGLSRTVMTGKVCGNDIRYFEIGYLDSGAGEVGPYNTFPGGASQPTPARQPFLDLGNNTFECVDGGVSFFLGRVNVPIPNRNFSPTGDGEFNPYNWTTTRAPIIGRYFIHDNFTNDKKYFRFVGIANDQHEVAFFQVAPFFRNNFFGDNSFCEGCPIKPDSTLDSIFEGSSGGYPLAVGPAFVEQVDEGWLVTRVYDLPEKESQLTSFDQGNKGWVCVSPGTSRPNSFANPMSGTQGSRTLSNPNQRPFRSGMKIGARITIQNPDGVSRDLYTVTTIKNDGFDIEVDRDLVTDYTDADTRLVPARYALYTPQKSSVFQDDVTVTGSAGFDTDNQGLIFSANHGIQKDYFGSTYVIPKPLGFGATSRPVSRWATAVNAGGLQSAHGFNFEGRIQAQDEVRSLVSILGLNGRTFFRQGLATNQGEDGSVELNTDSVTIGDPNGSNRHTNLAQIITNLQNQVDSLQQQTSTYIPNGSKFYLGGCSLTLVNTADGLEYQVGNIAFESGTYTNHLGGINPGGAFNIKKIAATDPQPDWNDTATWPGPNLYVGYGLRGSGFKRSLLLRIQDEDRPDPYDTKLPIIVNAQWKDADISVTPAYLEVVENTSTDPSTYYDQEVRWYDASDNSQIDAPTTMNIAFWYQADRARTRSMHT